MKIENIEEKTIIGFSIRTTNEKEMNPSTRQIADLWQKFDSNVTVDYRNGNRVFGVYFDYESDVSGEFTALVGTNQSNVNSKENLEIITIKSGKYLVFQAKGEIPKIVIDTWCEIWAFFSKNCAEYKRLYTTDFEYYVSQNEIKIYVAIE